MNCALSGQTSGLADFGVTSHVLLCYSEATPQTKFLQREPAHSLSFGRCPMTSEERERINALCNRIRKESDPKRFLKLIITLDRLLETQHQARIAAKPVQRANHRQYRR